MRLKKSSWKCDWGSQIQANSPSFSSIFRQQKARITVRCLLSLRLQRWSFLSGCPKVCMRGRGRCCLWSFPRCTERAGGPSSRLTPTWSTCIKWDPTTTVWDPRCYTLTIRRIQTLHKHCCRYKALTQTGRRNIRPHSHFWIDFVYNNDPQGTNI